MEEEIVREIMKECENWRERLLVKLFPNTYVKIYNNLRVKIVNTIMNN